MHRFAFVLGLAVLFVPCSRSDKKDPPKAAKVVKAGDVYGQVRKIDDELVLRVPIKQLDPKKVNDNLVWWQRKQWDLMRVNDPIQRAQQTAQAVVEYQRKQFDVFKDGHVDVAIDIADDAKFRRMNPPDKFDDKGNPAQYTQKELKELKGPDKLNGYQAELGDVKPGQYVLATLANPPKKSKDDEKKPKDDDSDKKDDKKKGASKNKERDENVQDVPFVVKVVYIYGEPAK